MEVVKVVVVVGVVVVAVGVVVGVERGCRCIGVGRGGIGIDGLCEEARGEVACWEE